jgi:hypothetical protein
MDADSWAACCIKGMQPPDGLNRTLQPAAKTYIALQLCGDAWQAGKTILYVFSLNMLINEAKMSKGTARDPDRVLFL